MAVKVTIKFTVPSGFRCGDFARLCGNGGAGAVDYDNPLGSRRHDLFPNGGGIFGFGLAPFGKHPFGRAWASRVPGYGRLPYGRHPFGLGTAVITETVEIDTCGTYLFGFAVYDSSGNRHVGTPGEVEVTVHSAPPRPAGLVKNSYSKTTDVLILDVA